MDNDRGGHAAAMRDWTQGLLQVAAAVARFGAWTVDVRTGEVSWTAEVEGIHDIRHANTARPEEVLDVYAPEHRSQLVAAYVACVREGTPFDLEVQALTTQSRRKWVRLVGVAVRGPAGDVLRVQGAYQDIHKAKVQSEEQRESAQLLRNTLESLTDGFLMVDRQWRITFMNPAAEAMLGLQEGALAGKVFWEAFPEADKAGFGVHYRRAMTGQACRFERAYPPFGMWFRVSAFPMRDGIAISFADITALRASQERLVAANTELERHVQEATARLRRANEDLASFTASVAHDLRAPLAGIEGFSRALAERLPADGDAKAKHYAARIRAAAARMESLLDALLELARLGAADMAARRVNLSAMALGALEALRAGEPGREVLVEVQPGLVAWGDSRLLRTVVENLVGNAWKFSAARSPARIEVGQREDGVFYVRDNGVGFDDDRAAEMFAPFRRLHGSEDFTGVGMGLASARRAVERHGGRIWAEGVPQAGAAFYFTLPAAG